ncbi:hypothetical protein DWU99_15210 [Dyella psychrodurans]|uniref:Uncharacterized protein n=2 Tax=Dyella psychrodurans TaxID=1927960 RepID=A0A370X0I3_9GAMM|nr:hypothetical protein DWU99_15210 [Dyella psychrodurans]
MAQGQKVGADLVVVVSPEYVASQRIVAPLPSPGASNSDSTGTAQVPVTINWFKYGALYFVKARPASSTAFVSETPTKSDGF